MRSPPPQFGSYLVLGILGEGGMGTVYLSRHPSLGFEVAIKTLRGQLKERGRERFRREIHALSRLQHPGLVEIFDTGEDEGALWYAMRRVEGGTLEDRLRTGPLLPRNCIDLGIQLSEAIHHAHLHRVLHRDLKPDNVLLGHNGRYVVTDFGLTKDLDESDSQRLSKSGALQGTPGYWAPEQAAGLGYQATPATDVYGVGAVLYAALTGRPPITGDSLIEVMVATRDNLPLPPSRFVRDLPRGLEALVLRCLEKKPSDRPSSLETLASELRALLEIDASGGVRPGVRHALYAIGALAACLCGALLAGALLSEALPPSEIDTPSRSRSPDAPSPTPTLPAPSSSGNPPAASPLASAAPPRPLEGLLKAAGAGDPQALFLVGHAYHLGKVVAQDDREALRWYRQAAIKGHGLAMSQLGAFYTRGLGVQQDYAEGVRWYELAAEAKVPEAMGSLGSAYHYGTGVEPDAVKAASWHRKAAELGLTNSMAYVGSLYLQGRTVKRDLDEGVRWIRRAVAGGDLDAMVLLSKLYLTGTGVPRDLSEGLLWANKAADAGDFPAMVHLGRVLLGRAGVEEDLPLAVRWFRRASEGGDVDGKVFYGHCLMSGAGVEQDEEAGVVLLEEAASRGHPRGALLFAEALAGGVGIEQDYVRAQGLFRKLAEEGDARGMHYLGWIAKHGHVGEPDPVEAVRWFERAAELRDRDSIYELGLAYRDGRGVTRDVDEALRWLSLALLAGEGRAQHGIGVLRYDAGDLTDALRVFRKNTRVHSALYAFLCVLDLEGRAAAEAQLRALLPKHKRSEWEEEMTRFLLGEVPEDEFLATAGKSENKRRERVCEATFFAAVLRSHGGDEAGARRLLEQCIATERVTYRQYWSAKALLKRMDSK